jgi:hypothetical protein
MSLVKIIVSNEQAELILTGLLDLPFKKVNQLIQYIISEIQASNKAMPANTVTVAPPATYKAYKYGLKKDGTPRKSPGRPAKKVTK